MPLDPRIRVCAVCGRVLDTVTGKGWQHPFGATVDGADDHPAVPVAPSEVFTVGFCDFCYTPDPPLEVPARDFLYPRLFPGHEPGASLGHWACCLPCGALIDANRWTALVRRCVEGHYRRYGEALHPIAVTAIRRLHRELRKHIDGPVRPSTMPRPDDAG